MQHLLIGAYAVLLITGCVSAYHLRTHYHARTRPFLKTYTYYILTVNFVVGMLAITKYYNANILQVARNIGFTRTHHVADILFMLRKGIEYFSIISIAYLLITIYYRMLERDIERFIKIIFILILIGSAFAYGIGVATYLGNATLQLDVICEIISGVSFLLVIAIFSADFIQKNSSLDNGIYSIRTFALIHVFIFSVILLATALQYHYLNLVIIAGILMINLFPLFWTREQLDLNDVGEFSIRITESDLAYLVAQYHITERELEICQYILQGYSNREIQKLLFISPHTVKNHNYNIYRKLGVSNRRDLLRKACEHRTE